MPNPRNAKLADQIREILASTIERRVKDPRLGFVTITDVRLTGDNREATVFYTVLGGEEERRDSAAALESATGMLRSALGAQLELRHTPSVTFMLDATVDAAKGIEDLLAQVHLRDEQAAAEASGKHYAGDADPYRTSGEDSTT